MSGGGSPGRGHESTGDPWIPVGDLAKGFEPDGYQPPPCGDLAGRTLTLHLSDGRVIEHRFESEEILAWKVLASGDAGLAGGGADEAREVRETYRAVRLRDGLYFVDYLKHEERASSVSLVLDLAAAMCTAVLGTLPEREAAERSLLRRSGAGLELTAVGVSFVGGTVDRPFTTEAGRHEVTADLLGKRVEYTYSPTERYEHIYLNENLYTWHCLAGVEKGLADTDRCHYYKLADDLYLFVWREKLVPTLGVVVTDYDARRSNGKIFGYEGSDFGALVNFPVGAALRVLNVTGHGG